MEHFGTLASIAASVPDDNVDTDIIFPARFLLLMDRDGLGRYAFHDRRFDGNGSEVPDFILNREPYRNARILIAGANFGCGSSREQAVWALLGFGIRCVIAPSFGEIFFGNCFRNGVLPIVLPPETVSRLAIDADAGIPVSVDLPAGTVRAGDGPILTFDLAEQLKLALINGWDETALILNAYGDDIAVFEARQRQSSPWLHEKDLSA